MNSQQTLENKAAKLILDLPPLSLATEVLATLHWSTISSRRYKHRCIFIYKCTNGLIDFDFNLTANSRIHSHSTRSCNNLHLPKVNTNWGKHKPTYLPSKDFNNLVVSVRITDSLSQLSHYLGHIPDNYSYLYLLDIVNYSLLYVVTLYIINCIYLYKYILLMIVSSRTQPENTLVMWVSWINIIINK